MQKINFQNYPSTTTPLDADNLNLLQSNIEDDIGDLTELQTTVKTDLVSAINEANQHGTGGGERLPVGSELDYTGNVSDIPTGWEQITDPNSYSTSEIKTDKTWVDGKPIYRKVYKLSTTNDSNLTVAHNLTNLDNFWINYDASFIIGNSESLPPNWYYGSTSDWGRLWISSDNIRFRSPNSLGSRDLYVVIEYTKTTD